jgi:hypothetical protein
MPRGPQRGGPVVTLLYRYPPGWMVPGSAARGDNLVPLRFFLSRVAGVSRTQPGPGVCGTWGTLHPHRAVGKEFIQNHGDPHCCTGTEEKGGCLLQYGSGLGVVGLEGLEITGRRYGFGQTPDGTGCPMGIRGGRGRGARYPTVPGQPPPESGWSYASGTMVGLLQSEKASAPFCIWV